MCKISFVILGFFLSPRISTPLYSTRTTVSDTAVGQPRNKHLFLAAHKIGSAPLLHGSVRDSLPGIFDLIAQQISVSYRKNVIYTLKGIPPMVCKRERLRLRLRTFYSQQGNMILGQA
jgi:hypothetical protein